MSEALPVGERAYRLIKHHLLDGGVAAGVRLDIQQLADAARVSTTPVREALHRLSGERIVENRAGDGFFVPRLGIAALRRLYVWHARLSAGAGDAPTQAMPEPAGYAARAATLFEAIVRSTDDPEVQWALQNADDRLRGLREVEPACVPEAVPQLVAIEIAWRSGDRARLRRELERRSRQLGDSAGEILDAASRAAASPPPA